jgi:hypothetical protein
MVRALCEGGVAMSDIIFTRKYCKAQLSSDFRNILFQRTDLPSNSDLDWIKKKDMISLIDDVRGFLAGIRDQDVVIEDG